MTGFSNRVALVTGAGSPEGIGFATAKALADAGTLVALTSTTERIFARTSELGKDHVGFIADLTKPGEVTNLIKTVRQKFGRIDIVINNAGMVQQGVKSRWSRIERMDDAEWHRHLDMNVTTAFSVTKAVLPLMQKQKYGRIVNVSSVTGPIVTNPSSAGYSAAKAAMTGLTRATAIENAHLNITCNAVLPGWIATGSSSKFETVAGNASPARRRGTASEVAAACLFLASEAASYVNGTTLVVDGANAIVEFKGNGADWY